MHCQAAQKSGATVLIFDTAGRSQLDEELMDELRSIKKKVEPVETLLVVDSMIGQEALHVAEGFRDCVQSDRVDHDQDGW